MHPGSGGGVRVELLGEDGRLLIRQLLRFAVFGRKVTVLAEMDFEIAAVAEAARLQVSAEDRFGRTTRLASVDVILLSEGEPDLNPPGDRLSPIIVQQPEPQTVAEGGLLTVSGVARPNSVQPLVVELITSEGNTVGSRLAEVMGPADGRHHPFTVDVPYDVSETTRVLLVVRERGDRIPGTTQLVSLELVLSP